jgi:hypothetical protein
MGFGVFGKNLRGGLYGGGFFDKIWNGVKNLGNTLVTGAGKVMDVAKPFVPIAGQVLDQFKPGAGTMLTTGFDVADGIRNKLNGGLGNPSTNKAKIAPRSKAPVDSVLRNPIVPKRAPVYTPSDDSYSEEDEY